MKHAISLIFHPLTRERWCDLQSLFGERGACGGCWCMVWRLTRSEFLMQEGAGNQAAFKRIVEAGDRPGILAYADGQPIGWCAVAPREAYSFLGRSRVLARLDDQPVWSVTCLFIVRPFRRKGVSVQLLRAAVAHAVQRGARIVEGYPVVARKDPMPDAFAWTGTTQAFQRAGFKEAARHSPTRPIMRFET